MREREGDDVRLRRSGHHRRLRGRGRERERERDKAIERESEIE